MNHSANADAMGLAHLVCLVVEIHKPVKERSFPDILMQGLEHLRALDRGFEMICTPDGYFSEPSKLCNKKAQTMNRFNVHNGWRL